MNDFNAEYPLDFYNFFKEIDCHYIQFAPIVERIVSHQDGRHLASLAEGKEGALADFSVSPEQWGNFLCTIFDEWVKEDVGKFFIQIFDSTLANWMGEQRAYVQWRSIAYMPALWNSTETYTLVTTSYSRNINWEISIAKLWWK